MVGFAVKPIYVEQQLVMCSYWVLILNAVLALEKAGHIGVALYPVQQKSLGKFWRYSTLLGAPI